MHFSCYHGWRIEKLIENCGNIVWMNILQVNISPTCREWNKETLFTHSGDWLIIIRTNFLRHYPLYQKNFYLLGHYPYIRRISIRTDVDEKAFICWSGVNGHGHQCLWKAFICCSSVQRHGYQCLGSKDWKVWSPDGQPPR